MGWGVYIYVTERIKRNHSVLIALSAPERKRKKVPFLSNQKKKNREARKKKKKKSDAATRYIYTQLCALLLLLLRFKGERERERDEVRYIFLCFRVGPQRAVRRPIDESHRSYWGENI
jgi:hypothetical protein